MSSEISKFIISKLNKEESLSSTYQLFFCQMCIFHVIKMEKYIFVVMVTHKETIVIIFIEKFERANNFDRFWVYRLYWLLNSSVVAWNIIDSYKRVLSIRNHLLPCHLSVIHLRRIVLVDFVNWLRHGCSTSHMLLLRLSLRLERLYRSWRIHEVHLGSVCTKLVLVSLLKWALILETSETIRSSRNDLLWHEWLARRIQLDIQIWLAIVSLITKVIWTFFLYAH